MRGFLYLVLAVGVVLFMLPVVWLVGGSLKPVEQVFTVPPTFFPRPLLWSNYAEALAKFPFWVGLKNTMTIVVGVLVGRVLTASLVAYGFARLRFPGRGALFIIVLATMMIPYHVVLIPQYLIFRHLDWLNTVLPIVVPNWFGGGAFFIFMLRQFFRTLNNEIDEAARIDGCGYFSTLWQVILPQSLPAIGTLAIFTFMWEWNDFLAPLIYLNTPDKMTLAVALRQWQFDTDATYREATWPELMVMSTVLTIPPVMVFFFLQRRFIQGVVITGVKG
ncbi:MAG: carbohydrate ABC transporter permease [Caldilineaceae bacterium]|nr:carbohydrate ABC transporter permease [Caldilineaceae bacterium]MCY4117855.1 carbohydrate ABC transporter permease [Caldilineaceae bacterium]MDE0182161.1 carbohydrate ABC transporter permease [Caldilineaceae bacterium]